MNTCKIIKLKYCANSADVFEIIRTLKRPVFLDSNHPNSQLQRFDIIAAEPIISLTTKNGFTEIYQDKTALFTSRKNPFDLLQQMLNKYAPSTSIDADMPFSGGAIGFFSYDLSRNLETLPSIAANDLDIPEMDVGIYLWAIVIDHSLQQTKLIAHQSCNSDQLHKIQTLLSTLTPSPSKNNFQLQDQFQSNITKDEYYTKHQTILDYINAGDCYQVNLAQRFNAPCKGDPWHAYKEIRKHTDAPFSAFMQFDNHSILCLSPERFIHLKAQMVETSPIKGTAPRNSNLIDDQKCIKQLTTSTKDRAENIMIVDLLRNDLGKSCIPGSINVTKLFEVQSYSNVHHLVSTIKGTLPKNKQALDILKDCFPGGSITGAPKLRAMEIIEELEPNRRTAYCGSVAYIDFNGRMDSNIAIRTLIHHENNIYCWGGGGIVADSIADKEYLESYIKVKHLLKILAQLNNTEKMENT